MTTIAERVEAGAAWLDENSPGWVDRIDLERLDLGSSCNCVLGQEFGLLGAGAAHLYADFDAAFSLGFDTQFGYRALTAVWRDYITARRAA